LTKTFSVYRSSAGSGKTRTLAKAYLRLALKYRNDYFKHILAVTFTNKASQEMKDRILQYLDDFAQGRDNELAKELQKELAMDAQTFQQHSQEAQSLLLHQYDSFAISTIDAFFQKVIRSFIREAGITGDYRLEVDQDAVLEEVIDNLIDELGENKELTDWVVDFAKENLENERSWDVRYSLIDFAREIFREEFKGIEDVVSKTTAGKDFFTRLRESGRGCGL
jgi:ATP-dependent helicase/nuclease subunit A